MTTSESPETALNQLANLFSQKANQKEPSSAAVLVQRREFAQFLDQRDPLKTFRHEFCIPTKSQVAHVKSHDPQESIQEATQGSLGDQTGTSGDEPCVYLCGNSLGLRPQSTARLIAEELDVWAKSGVHGHFSHDYQRPWVSIDDLVVDSMARVVGAKREEVSVLNSLTVNLHLLMVSFYRPTAQRHKIIIEDKAFPSDHYAVCSQIEFHGYDPAVSLVRVSPRPGEHTLRHEDILSTIETHGNETALVMFSGVQYYTGQLFNMSSIVEAGHKKGCIVGFDLAHAVGNAVLKLHDWNADFAAWCSYKYLNSGPGCIAGLFVHERHFKTHLPRFAGWWGNRGETRFQMRLDYDPIEGANVYRMSNPHVLAVVSLYSSLQIFDKTSMATLNEKTFLLTGYLELLLVKRFKVGTEHAPFSIITPASPKERGCQLSLLFKSEIKTIFAKLTESGVVCDKREPDCIRIAPAPLYNSFEDVWNFVDILSKVTKI